MKSIIITVLLFIICSVAESQTIYGIAFTDTDDGSIGKGCENDLKNIKKYFQRVKNCLGYQLRELYYAGDKFTKENYNDIAKNVNSSPNDIIILYISSHGERSAEDTTPFPQIYVNGETVSAYYMHKELIKHPHKSLMTIIDACNVVRNISPDEEKIFKKTYTEKFVTLINDKERKLVKKVLVDDCFDLIVTSSQIGVGSLTTPNLGSIFTNNFLSAFSYYVRDANENLASIENILSRSNDYTLNETQRIYINEKLTQTKEDQPHHPVWELAKRRSGVIKKDASASQFNIKYDIVKLTPEQKRKLKVSNDYMVDISIDSAGELFQKIEQVKYFLHPTFRNPIITRLNKNEAFKYRIFIWGEFLLRCEIKLEDGSVIDVAKELGLPPS